MFRCIVVISNYDTRSFEITYSDYYVFAFYTEFLTILSPSVFFLNLFCPLVVSNRRRKRLPSIVYVLFHVVEKSVVFSIVQST